MNKYGLYSEETVGVVQPAPKTDEIASAKKQMENLAKQDAAAGEVWGKAVRYNKIIQKLKKERDEARDERDKAIEKAEHYRETLALISSAPVFLAVMGPLV